MSAFADWPISRKALAAFAAVVAAIFVSSAIVFDRLRVIDDARNWRIHSTDVLETVAVYDWRFWIRKPGCTVRSIGGDEKYLEPYHKGAEAFAATMRRLRNLSSDNPSLSSAGSMTSMRWRTSGVRRSPSVRSR